MKVGDLVSIRNGVHQEDFPVHKQGIIVAADKEQPHVFSVMFFGSKKSHTFHQSSLILLKK
tara:strand:- start:556 stop:738 length:183 start_codon:yes stop_codon:yes gene_type:complete